MDPQEVLDEWPIPTPRVLRPASAGLNNLSRVVDTPEGSYFLRIYQNTTDTARVRYEHALLLQLHRASLSFEIPMPLATRGGETFVATTHAGDDVVASLFQEIPGRHPRYGDVSQAAACGEALGELDDALAHVELDRRLLRLGTFGDLQRVHPSVPDPIVSVEQLRVSAAKRRRLRVSFEELFMLVPDLYERLPRQIIHSDLFRGNALMLDGSVSGLLDFEFASPDLRAMDFAVGLFAFGVPARKVSGEWSCIEAFTAGYGRRVALSSDEILALPALLRLREATSLVHWIGRLHQGLTMEGEILRRADDLLDLDDWLREHDRELVLRVEDASR